MNLHRYMDVRIDLAGGVPAVLRPRNLSQSRRSPVQCIPEHPKTQRVTYSPSEKVRPTGVEPITFGDRPVVSTPQTTAIFFCSARFPAARLLRHVTFSKWLLPSSAKTPLSSGSGLKTRAASG